MHLSEYQEEAHKTSKSKDIEVFTLGLIGEAGSLASAIKKLKRENSAEAVVRDEIKTELGDTLWYVAEIATFYELSLSDVASQNIEKTKFLFNGSTEQLDKDAPTHEQFPKEAVFTFLPDSDKIAIQVDGQDFGDPLDDNAHGDDGYRFHDIFHIAFMTVLGWSPVIRSLMGRKRKYDEKVDRVEDGARSIFLEEGISVFIFNQNVRTKSGTSVFADRRNIPFFVLSSIKVMTKELEVNQRDISAWRDAIALGYQMFDQLKNNNGGVVRCDLEARKISYEKPN